ncbi:hypothetical protein KCP76_11940 [Salmonella enterica subsp. enterica serovar Weltevreden]|nr:hypothetical protein KCP76_11940 [Salmonella enterica subsp. enterica serovar Weltevreden]
MRNSDGSLPVNTSANAGSAVTATRRSSSHLSLLHQPAGEHSSHAEVIPAGLYLLTIQRSLPYELCCCVTVNLRQNRNLKRCASPVRHFNRVKRESDTKIHITAPVNSTAPAHNRILTLPFQPF